MEVPESIKKLVERAGNSSAWHAASALPKAFYSGGMDTMTSPSSALTYASEHGPEALKTLAKITGSVAIPAATVLGGVQIGRHLLGRGEDEHKHAAIREDAVRAVLAHYNVGHQKEALIQGAMNAMRTVGGAARGAFDAARAVAPAAQRAEGAMGRMGTALSHFNTAGGTEAAKNLALGGAAVAGTGLAAGAGLRMAGIGRQQQPQQQQPPQYR